MSMLRNTMEWLEGNIDLKHLEEAKVRLKKALLFDSDAQCAVLIGDARNSNFEPVPVQETHSSMELMMYNELLQVCNGIAVRDDRQYSIRANYGIGILPSLFGVKSTFANNTSMPWCEHISDKDEVRRIIAAGVPDIKCGFGQKLFETYEFYANELEKYPSLKDAIRLYHPDMQGPLDVAHLLLGSEMYYDMYDEPQLVHELLSLVTDTYIALMKEIKKVINDEEDGFNWHWNTMCRGNIVLRNDTCVNLSTEMYKEFVQPYDEKLMKEFGGATIHYCGEQQSWLEDMLKANGLVGINFGYVPWTEHYEYGEKFLSKVYALAEPRRISNISYPVEVEQLPQIIEKGYCRGTSFVTFAKDLKKAKEFLASVR